MSEDNSNGYNGNPLLKKPRESVNWDQEKIKEWIRCANDPIYFAEKYIRLVHVDRGFIPMILYDYQKEIIDKIFNNRRLAVLTSRQAGKTSTAVAVILHYVLFNSFKRVAIIANKGSAAAEVLQRIKLAYEALPKWLQHGILRWNAGDISLENGSSIVTGATTSSSIRGKSVNFLYIDEAAFIDSGWEEFFSSVYPTISSGETTKMLMTSTPNGLNHYYSICTGAKEKTNGYEYVEVSWDRVPGRGDKWKQETLESLNFNYEQFSAEFECIHGTTNIQIRNKNTKEIQTISIEELYNILP